MWSSVLGLVSNFTPFSQARLWSMLWMRTYLSSNMSFYFQFTFLGNPITYCFGKTQYLLVIIIDIYFIKLIKLLSCWSLSVFEKNIYWTIFFTWSYSASCLSQRTPTPPPSKTKKVEDYSKLQHHLYLACRNTVHNGSKTFMKLQLSIFDYNSPKISCDMTEVGKYFVKSKGL